ncbi:MAG: efflux RND transporter periplasmic adaptor subunit [Bacteroidota bacterium]
MRKVFYILTSILLLASCSGEEQTVVKKPTMSYKVIPVQKTSTTLIAEYPATLEGIIDVDIRSKIDGYIDAVYVQEGQEVKKGQILFKISNPMYAQELQSLAAAVATAETAVSTAALQVEKTKPLVEQGIISNFELRNVELALLARKSDLMQAKARYNNAQTNVGYTSIKSPVDGIIGLLPFRVGSYVSSATTQALTRVSDIRTVYANFSINEKQQLNIILNAEGSSFADKITKMPPVSLKMSNDAIFENKGKIESFSGQASSSTGSYNVRASFDNKSKILRSGSSASVQIPTDLTNVIVIPQSATIELQDKRMAFIVDKDNKVTAVPITVRAIPGGQFFVVDSGLSINDKLLIEGVGIVTEGTIVKPEPVDYNSIFDKEIKK